MSSSTSEVTSSYAIVGPKPTCILSISWCADDVEKSVLFRSKLIAELDGVAFTDTATEIRCTWKTLSGSLLLEEATSVTFVCTTVYAAPYIRQATNRHLHTLLGRIGASTLVKDVKHLCQKYIGGGVIGGVQ